MTSVCTVVFNFLPRIPMNVIPSIENSNIAYNWRTKYIFIDFRGPKCTKMHKKWLLIYRKLNIRSQTGPFFPNSTILVVYEYVCLPRDLIFIFLHFYIKFSNGGAKTAKIPLKIPQISGLFLRNVHIIPKLLKKTTFFHTIPSWYLYMEQIKPIK